MRRYCQLILWKSITISAFPPGKCAGRFGATAWRKRIAAGLIWNKDNEEGCLTRSSFNYCNLYANISAAMNFLNNKSTSNDALTFYCWFWYFCHESRSLPPLKKPLDLLVVSTALVTTTLFCY